MKRFPIPTSLFALTVLGSFCPLLAYGQKTEFRPDSIFIYRDNWGVPHIYGPTDGEVAYGLAWAHAEDDFSTIEETMLSGRGILAEAKGKDAAMLDFFIRFFEIPSTISLEWKSHISPEFQEVLYGYCAGLNAYAVQHPKEVLYKRALPYTPEDILGGYMLSFLLFTGTAGDLGDLLQGSLPKAQELPGGSNAFALSKNQSKDGNTWLFLNPHNSYKGRYSWYEAHTKSGTGTEMYGALFPGGVTIFHGFNQYLAWAHTFNYHDMVDVYTLETNPEKTQYKVNNQWLPLEAVEVKIKVKAGPIRVPVKRTKYNTLFGPAMEGPQGIYAIRNAAIYGIKAAEQWWHMGASKSLEQFEEALAMDGFPMLNIVYVDQKDNLMLRSQTHLPQRKMGPDWNGVLWGVDTNYIWHKPIPYTSRPVIKNPIPGFLFNANNSPYSCTCEGIEKAPDSTQYFPGIQTIETNRSHRIQELLDSLGCPDSPEAIRHIKYDRQYPKDGYVWNGFRNHLEAAKPVPEDLKPIYEVLYAWNGNAEKESVGAAQFVEFAKRLSQITGVPLQFMYLRNHQPPQAQIHQALGETQHRFMEHFNRVDISLGEVQRVGRGSEIFPRGGIKETLAPTETRPLSNGYYAANGGDSFIMEVCFTSKDRVEARAVQAFGNSNNSSSAHYNDQTALFANDRLREVLFYLPLNEWKCKGYTPKSPNRNN